MRDCFLLPLSLLRFRVAQRLSRSDQQSRSDNGYMQEFGRISEQLKIVRVGYRSYSRSAGIRMSSREQTAILAVRDGVRKRGGGKAWAAPAAGICSGSSRRSPGGQGFSGSGVASNVATKLAAIDKTIFVGWKPPRRKVRATDAVPNPRAFLPIPHRNVPKRLRSCLANRRRG